MTGRMCPDVRIESRQSRLDSYDGLCIESVFRKMLMMLVSITEQSQRSDRQIVGTGRGGTRRVKVVG
jgi:hypothetical protein